MADDVDTPEKEAVIPENENEITCYIPKNLNINYLGEWILKLGSLCYGISVRGSDRKVMITYNINPDGLHPDHFVECVEAFVPAKIYEMLQKKLSSDIMRLDNMMNNLIANKGRLNELFNFAEKNKGTSTSEFEGDVFEYTEEDAQKDKEIEKMKAQNQMRFLNNKQKKTRQKAKAAKVAKKKSRRRA